MPKKPDINRLLEFHNLLFAFQTVHRITHIPKTFEQENDTEHSYNLAMMAWFLAQYFPHLDRDIIIRYALVHDLVEIHAGDTYVYADPAIIATKKKREKQALQRLQQDWPDFPELLSTIKEYETHASEEAKFVYALDKIMPIIVIFLSEGYTWQQEGTTLEQLHEIKKHKVTVSKEISPYYDALYELLQQHRHYFSSGQPKA